MKKIISIATLSLLLFPLLALAQWDVGDNYGLPDGSIYDIIENILLWLLGLLGLLGIIAFAISGIMYLVSAGDDSMAEKAKKAMTYAILGMVVALAGFVIIQAIDALLDLVGKA